MPRTGPLICTVIIISLAGCGGFFIEISGNADEDGLNYSQEQRYATEPTDPDTDSDGLEDGPEIMEYETRPRIADTDSDGLDDGSEVREYETDPTIRDTDSDGLDDAVEVREYETDPTNRDTDEDGLPDGQEIDNHNTDPTNRDTDEDGIPDGVEINDYNTDPTSRDTDGDGLTDAEEIDNYSTDPLIADSDGDGLTDAEEINQGSLPTYRDTDGDGIRDGLDPDPLHRDRYVVIQNQGCGVASDDLRAVSQAFDTAPIPNPDGNNGINLRFLNERNSTLYGAAPRAYHIARFQPSVTNQGGLVSGYMDYPYLYVDCSYNDDVMSMIFMHELGHASGITGEGVDSTKIPFNDYQSVMNYNRPRSYIGYTEGEWQMVAESTNSSHSPSLQEYENISEQHRQQPN